MTTEQMRDLQINDIDSALDSWLVRRTLTEEQKRRLRANRNYWQKASTEALQNLLTEYEKEPVRAALDVNDVPTALEKAQIKDLYEKATTDGGKK